MAASSGKPRGSPLSLCCLCVWFHLVFKGVVGLIEPPCTGAVYLSITDAGDKPSGRGCCPPGLLKDFPCCWKNRKLRQMLVISSRTLRSCDNSHTCHSGESQNLQLQPQCTFEGQLLGEKDRKEFPWLACGFSGGIKIPAVGSGVRHIDAVVEWNRHRQRQCT